MAPYAESRRNAHAQIAHDETDSMKHESRFRGQESGLREGQTERRKWRREEFWLMPQ